MTKVRKDFRMLKFLIDNLVKKENIVTFAVLIYNRNRDSIH